MLKVPLRSWTSVVGEIFLVPSIPNSKHGRMVVSPCGPTAGGGDAKLTDGFEGTVVICDTGSGSAALAISVIEMGGIEISSMATVWLADSSGFCSNNLRILSGGGCGCCCCC